jgi:hypothetical protein
LLKCHLLVKRVSVGRTGAGMRGGVAGVVVQVGEAEIGAVETGGSVVGKIGKGGSVGAGSVAEEAGMGGVVEMGGSVVGGIRKGGSVGTGGSVAEETGMGETLVEEVVVG